MDEQVDQLLLKVRPQLLARGEREATLRLLVNEAVGFLSDGADAERVFADAWERELVESTCIGMGLAVPHARVEGLRQSGVYVAFCPEGIPWPHEEAQLIALLIVPWENPEMHLQLLSRLVRWRRNLTEAEACALAESQDKLMVSLDDAFLDML